MCLEQGIMKQQLFDKETAVPIMLSSTLKSTLGLSQARGTASTQFLPEPQFIMSMKRVTKYFSSSFQFSQYPSLSSS